MKSVFPAFRFAKFRFSGVSFEKADLAGIGLGYVLISKDSYWWVFGLPWLFLLIYAGMSPPLIVPVQNEEPNTSGGI
ncbi:MAG: hypothetical protein CM1200mP39_20780 [Dehalococcoidia bacterium]|nr:MAG: hypothetical protein CM1200mP39_20780 [Dehalococcoidia bacterium]